MPYATLIWNATATRRILWRGREIRASVVSHLAMMPAHRSVKPGIFLARTPVGAAGAHFGTAYGTTGKCHARDRHGAGHGNPLQLPGL